MHLLSNHNKHRILIQDNNPLDSAPMYVDPRILSRVGTHDSALLGLISESMAPGLTMWPTLPLAPPCVSILRSPDLPLPPPDFTRPWIPWWGFIYSAPLALVILLRPCIRLLRQRILPSAAMATGGRIDRGCWCCGAGLRRGKERRRREASPRHNEDRSLDGELEERVDESIPEHRLFF